MKYRQDWNDAYRYVIDVAKAIGCLLVPIMAALAFAMLSGCTAAVSTTTPSPESAIDDGNFQMRLHQTRGSGLGGIESGILALPYASTQAGAEGAADGCTLTVLGTPPEEVNAHLEAGKCKAELNK